MVEFIASKVDNFNLKWRAYIEFRTLLKIHPVQIFSELQEILCVDCSSRSTVERWAARFRSGDADVTDLPRSGRPVSATTLENIALIESMVMEDSAYCQSVRRKYGDFIGSYSYNSDH
ncbi:Transposase [Oopsacas minuta]|uniref:Transposase n=1 Tax=Oopsacas minuta TaxID=111878 RepID=A0AAV7JVI0_9METZ|nr:Transposase [Oopsacas minuta]